MNKDREVKACISDIDHTCDGPVTPTVAIYRACKLASEHAYDHEIVAEALEQVMEDNDWVNPEPRTVHGRYPS